jgi:hypothetical protein
MLNNQLIRQAFENLIVVFGERASHAIITDLQSIGVYLRDPSLTLKKLSRGLSVILGEEIGTLLIQNVIIELDRLHAPLIRQ